MQSNPVSITLIAISPREFYVTMFIMGVAIGVAHSLGKRAGAKEAAENSK
jgi:hypothetical protein